MERNLLTSFAPLIILILFFYFAMYRPQKKKETKIREMRDNLAVGDEIVTIGGIRGKVIVVKEDMVTIESGATKTRLDIMKWAVGNLVED